jgi:glucosamine-phosphate N-acetyltransferase
MLKVKPVQFKDFFEVVNMLQSISNYKPSDKDAQLIWESFNIQNNIKGFSFFYESQIVGYGSIIYETKIRGGIAGHIEDIVIDDRYRGKGYGKFIIDYLIEDARNYNCYKISLSCKEHNVSFYKKCGFNQDGFTMQIQL